MNKREAFDIGRANGITIARVQVREAPVGTSCDKLLEEVLETESEHFRQYSPFEFTASAINRSRNPEALWEAYEQGVGAGARRVLRRAGCRPGRNKPRQGK